MANIKPDLTRQIQVNARLTLGDKLKLLELAKAKGAEGITGLLKMIAKAKKVEVTI